MIQPATWKAIAEYSGKAWTALGPLVGVLIGARLAHTWDSRKWLRENRKEECRKLLSAVSDSATKQLADPNLHRIRERYLAYLRSVRAFHTCIFVAKDMEQEKLLDIWANAVHDFGTDKDAKKFDDSVKKVRDRIIEIATKK